MTNEPPRPTAWWLKNVALPIAIVAAIAIYLAQRRELFDALGDVSARELAIVAVLVVAGHFINAFEFGRLYRAVGANISVFENWMLFTAGQLGNYFPAQLGTLYRFRYLKRRHGLSTAAATAGYGANLMITILASGVLGLAGAVWIGTTESVWSAPLILGLSALIALGVAAALIPMPTSDRDQRVWRAWRRFATGWQEIRTDRGTAVTVLLLELLRSGLTAWRLQLTFAWLGFDQPFAFFLVIGSASALVTFVAFTPAGLGIREVSIGVVAVELSRPFDDGLAASSVDRAMSLAVVVVLGLVGLAYTSKQLRAGPAEAAASHDVAT